MNKLRKIRSILLVMLALALVLALVAACDNGETPDGPDNTTDTSKKTITGVTFVDTEITYDGNEHEITVSGTIPEGVEVNYSNNKRTETGTQTATAVLSGEEYNTLTLTAKLTIKGQDITGVTFSGDTFTYDGTEHEITVSGTLPQGVSVEYSNNKATDADEYDAVATLSGKGYNTLTLTAKLIINKATISTANLSFSDYSCEYDAKQHSITIVGNPPAGVSVTYYYNGEQATSIAYPGEHTVEAVLSSKNHHELTLTAKLTITSKEEMLYSAFFNGNVYFQNSLDGNRLYRATGTGTPAKVSNDVATYFTTNGTNLYYYSDSLFTQTIKELSSSKISSVYSPGRATYLASDTNGNIYYAKANLVDTKGENGIYKVNITAGSEKEEGQEPTAIRLTTDKANYIAYYNGYIYYCNTSDGSKLYRIAVTANNGTGTALTSNKVSDIVVADGAVYYTLHTLTNSSIQKYTISSGTTTNLCIDNGAYLTKVGNYIYYVNKDLLTSNVFGKGIYRVSINGGSTVGEKVIDAEEIGDCYYSLASDGGYLYYYRASTKHFYRYNISSKTETDLMLNFVPTETATFTGHPYAHIATYDGEIYYTDVLDTNSLYKHNPQTNATIKVLSDSVSNVYFHNGYMYYSTFVVTNYALWKLEMGNPEAEPIKISSHRYENLIFDGENIYAIRVAAAASYNNRIVKLSPPALGSGTELYDETILYQNRNLYIAKLYLLDGIFHFNINPNPITQITNPEYIYTHELASSNTKQEDKTTLKSNNFVIYNATYYYYNHNQKTFCSSSIANSNETKITDKVEITDIYEYNGVVYYTSISSQNSGIYAYDTSAGTTTKLTSKVGHGFQAYDGKLYFINIALTYTFDYPSRSSGDGHLYSIDIESGTESKVV